MLDDNDVVRLLRSEVEQAGGQSAWARRERIDRALLNIPPKAPVIDQHNGRPTAQSAWAKSIEKVNSKQADLKQRAAATTEWGSVVEKLSIRLKHQAVAARAEALARTVEKLRSRHTGLPVRMADSEFDRVWYGHCPDEAAPKPVALGPEPLNDDGAA